MSITFYVAMLFLWPDCETLLGFPPNVLLINSLEKNLTRFQLVHPHVCKQLNNQKEPFLEEASLLFWITVWEIVFPCLVSLRAAYSGGLMSHVSLINTPLWVNQAHILLWRVFPSLMANIQSAHLPKIQMTLLCNTKRGRLRDYRNHISRLCHHVLSCKVF